MKALKLLLLAAPVIVAIVLAGTAFGDPATNDMARAQAAGE